MPLNESKFVVSYGGGVNSTAMIIWLITHKRPIDCVIFSDTGNEVPETYKYIERHMGPYLEKRNIPFVAVYNYSKISLWAKCMVRRVFPDTYRRWCTGDFEVRPIRRFYRTQKNGSVTLLVHEIWIKPTYIIHVCLLNDRK